MNKIDGEDNWILFVIGAAFAVFVACKFSGYFGLSREVAGSVFSWIAVLIVLGRLSMAVKGDFPRLRPENTWPILMGLIWVCWWPAMDYRVAHSMAQSGGLAQDFPWWVTRYAKWGGLVGIVTLGYLARKLFRRF